MTARRAAAAEFLGDQLGPRGRSRVVVGSVVAGLALAALLVAAGARFASHGQLSGRLWRPFARWSVLRFILVGMWHTLEAAAAAIALSMAAGIVLAAGRMAGIRPVRWLARAWIEFFRAMPLILLILFCYIGLPREGVHLSPFRALVLGLTVYNGAVLGEIFRAGVLSLDRGQREAASALGLGYGQAMASVILPQAVRRMAPAIVSQLITVLKDTALGYVINYDDGLRRADQTGTFFGNFLQAAIFIAACYIVVNLVLSRVAHRLEVRQQRRLGASTIEVAGVEDLAVVGASASAVS
ncbi:MAG: amino acid ABC transporter permease [Acidimicrobiales bacterium]